MSTKTQQAMPATIRTEQVWLVEIRLKDWEPNLPGNGRVVSFEEVVASNEYSARHAGYGQFAARCNFEPVIRRKMLAWGITEHNCCAPDAVQVS
jgi:hypothetical protein